MFNWRIAKRNDGSTEANERSIYGKLSTYVGDAKKMNEDLHLARLVQEGLLPERMNNEHIHLLGRIFRPHNCLAICILAASSPPYVCFYRD